MTILAWWNLLPTEPYLKSPNLISRCTIKVFSNLKNIQTVEVGCLKVNYSRVDNYVLERFRRNTSFVDSLLVSKPFGSAIP